MDNFPFGLSYVYLYDRYGKIRRTVRHCLAVYPHNDAYRNALLTLDRVLTAVIEDNQIMFNVIGKNAPLSKRGFDTDLTTLLSSVSHETYKKCMERKVKLWTSIRQAGIVWLKFVQNADSGWGRARADKESEIESTALAIIALLKFGKAFFLKERVVKLRVILWYLK